MPKIVSPTAAAVQRAADVLRSGGGVALPTETVYGLGADTFNESALRHVYEIKGRPSDNPLIAHVLNQAQACTLAADWDDRCKKVADAFWPGPLTLVVTKAPHVPELATAGFPTIAIRSPSHPVARHLLTCFDGPISAPSANRSGHISPTTAQHVAADFADVDDLLILDGGPCDVGIESTVLDMTRESPTILRPGTIGADALHTALGERVQFLKLDQQSAAPGTALSHYAPRTPVLLITASAVVTTLADLQERAVVLSMHLAAVDQPHVLIAMPQESERYASQLYDALRRADAVGATRIIIELPEQTGGTWDAVRDRLHRAAS